MEHFIFNNEDLHKLYPQFTASVLGPLAGQIAWIWISEIAARFKDDEFLTESNPGSDWRMPKITVFGKGVLATVGVGVTDIDASGQDDDYMYVSSCLSIESSKKETVEKLKKDFLSAVSEIMGNPENFKRAMKLARKEIESCNKNHHLSTVMSYFYLREEYASN